MSLAEIDIKYMKLFQLNNKNNIIASVVTRLSMTFSKLKSLHNFSFDRDFVKTIIMLVLSSNL